MHTTRLHPTGRPLTGVVRRRPRAARAAGAVCLVAALLAGCGGTGSTPAGAAVEPAATTTQEPRTERGAPAATTEATAGATQATEATQATQATQATESSDPGPVGSRLVGLRTADEPDDSVRTLSTGTPYALDPCERAVRLDRREAVLTSVWKQDGRTQVRQVAVLDNVAGGASEYAWLQSGLRSCVEGPVEGLWEEDPEAYVRTQPEWGIGLDEEQRVQAFAAIVPGTGSTTDLHVVMRRGPVVTVSTVRSLDERPHGGSPRRTVR